MTAANIISAAVPDAALAKLYPSAATSSAPGTAAPMSGADAPVRDAVSLAASCTAEAMVPRDMPCGKADYAAADAARAGLVAAGLPHGAAVEAFSAVAAAMRTGEAYKGDWSAARAALKTRWGAAAAQREQQARAAYGAMRAKAPGFAAAVERLGLNADPRFVVAMSMGRAR